MEAVGKSVDLPPLATDEQAHHVEHLNRDLVGYLLSAGPVRATGMGAVNLSHSCLRDWMSNMATVLSPWDCDALVAMSQAYASAQSEYSEKRISALWGVDEAEQRKKVSQQIRAGFASMGAG